MIYKVKTVKAYLDALPPDRRKAIAKVRSVIRKHLPKGYREGIQYGHIGYFVPHSIFPDGYHCDPSQPLPFAGLGSQKRHMTVGLMSLYGSKKEETWLRAEWKKTGKRLDMGKCCVRFRKIEDLPLELIGRAIARVPVKRYIDAYIAMRPAASKPVRMQSGIPTAAK